VVTLPFRFDGSIRNQQAREGLAKWDVDRLVTVRLDDLSFPRGTTLRQAFELADVEVARVVERMIDSKNVLK